MYAKIVMIKVFAYFFLYVIQCYSVNATTRKEEAVDQHQDEGSSKFSRDGQEKAIWGIAEEQLDELFNDSPDLVALANSRFFTRVNSAWTEGLGWSESELLSRPFMDDIHPEDSVAAADIISQGISHNSSAHIPKTSDVPTCKNSLLNYDNRRRSREGNYHDLQWLILLQVSGYTASAPLLCIGKDVTLQKLADKQRLALEQARSTAKMKSTFVAHMSHEIRTPLNGIIGFIELALAETTSKKVQSYLQHAHASALLLLDIANDIIDVSRIEAGVLKIERADFNLQASMKDAIDILKYQAENKKINLRVSFSSSIPEILRGDQSRIKQILFNLGNNALKFTPPEGKISLKINGRTSSDQPHLFILQGTMKDSGIGMEPEFIQKLFQPFSQEERNMSKHFGSSGLGLYITKELCRKMGGSIKVMSTPGMGSTFQFKIILERPEKRLSDLKESNSVYYHSSAVQLPVKKVLIVDDNSMNQLLLKEIMTRYGCTVEIAENGEDALKAIQEKTYELILMDGEMPDLDGLEATKIIRQTYSVSQLPIIGITAHAMSDHRQQFLEAGMNGYLTKPINTEKLLDEVLRCCTKKDDVATIKRTKRREMG